MHGIHICNMVRQVHHLHRSMLAHSGLGEKAQAVCICLNQPSLTICGGISSRYLFSSYYFLHSLCPPTSSESWLLSLQPDCSNKSNLPPRSAAFYFFLRLFLFSQHPAAVRGGNSLNENHILERRGVMGCEVGVCLSLCGSKLFELAACIKQVRWFYPNRTTDLIKGMSKCDQIKSSGYFKQELSHKRFLHST